MPEPLKVLIVDDHRLFTAGLAAIIQLLPRPVHVMERENARSALKELEAGLHVDLLLVDVEMPSLNGLDMLVALARRSVDTRSIVISASGNRWLVERAVAAGARGFVSKSLSPATMIEAIERVLAGGRHFPEDAGSSAR